MNPKNIVLIASIAALACLAFAQTPKPAPPSSLPPASAPQVPSDLALRVASLETELVLLKAQVSQMRASNAQFATFVRTQGESAQALLAVLDDSEQKGFTFGINPDSRIVLLSGMRNFLTSLQQNVPPLVPVAAPVDAKTGTPAKPPVKGN
jgi:hypothetical protein